MSARARANRTPGTRGAIQLHVVRHGAYEWVLEGDITACFDEIDHTALMGLVRQRITDKRALALVKAFLKAGIFSRETGLRESHEGAPQGGILSPLLSNIALSVLDEHFDRKARHRRSLPRRQQRGQPVFRLSRYADDWVLPVKGQRADVEALRDEAATVLATVGLRLSQAKTVITHIDEGLDFLGWRIQRHRKPGTAKSYIYTYPSKKAVKAVTGKVRTLSRLNRNQPLESGDGPSPDYRSPDAGPAAGFLPGPAGGPADAGGRSNSALLGCGASAAVWPG